MNEQNFLEERRRTRRIFNLAALIYPIIEKNLFPQYRKTLSELNLPDSHSVLDFATGTGILAGAFTERGHSVRGIDFSTRLLKRAIKNFPEIEFQNLDLFELDETTYGKYDIVAMGYLLHGLSTDLRRHILTKAALLSSQYVLIFDHGKAGNWVVDLIEWLEGSCYKQFIAEDMKTICAEAGLKIKKEFETSDYGHVWLCEKF